MELEPKVRKEGEMIVVDFVNEQIVNSFYLTSSKARNLRNELDAILKQAGSNKDFDTP